MITVYIERGLRKYTRAVKYILDYTFMTLGYEYRYISRLDQLGVEDILFYYGLICPTLKEAYILALNRLLVFIPFEQKLYDFSVQQETLISQDIRSVHQIPVLTGEEISEPVRFFRDDDLCYISFNFDLTGNLFYRISDNEGRRAQIKDELGRISDKNYSTLAERNLPYLNYLLIYLDSYLQKGIQDFGRQVLVKKHYWPKSEAFAAAVSHNVDRLQKWNFLSLLKSCFQDLVIFYQLRFMIKNFLSKLRYLLTNEEQYWNFGIITELEKKYQISSTWFWSGLGNKGLVDYEITDEDCLAELQLQQKSGREIALLASADSARNDNLKSQKHLLEKYFPDEYPGLRNIAHRIEPDLSNELYNKNGFLYYSGATYVNHNGFKNGLGFPYYQYTEIPGKTSESDFVRKYCLDIPLAFSDEKLKLSRYRQLDYKWAKQLITDLIDQAEKGSALLSLDFSVANFADLEYDQELFSFTLQELRKRDVYIASLRELALWWKIREAVVLKDKFEGIEVYFPYAVENFTLQIFGNYQQLEYREDKIRKFENLLFFSNVKADSRFFIRIIKQHG